MTGRCARSSRDASESASSGASHTTTFPRWLSAADVVCGPALVEPFGQALLEGLACGKPVVATRIGGPPEFVPDGGGVLVDPLDTPGSRVRSRSPPRSPCRTTPRARQRPSTTSGVRRSGWRRSSSEPFEIGEPDLDQRANPLLETVLAGDRERLLVALPDLLGRDALLQAVVARQQQIVDLLARFSSSIAQVTARG